MADKKKNKNNKNTNKIVFRNERSQFVTKVENTTGGWRFFGYLYNTAMFRVLLLQLLMLIFVVPVVALIFISQSRFNALAQSLPYSATFGLGIMPWFGLQPYLTASMGAVTEEMYLWMLLCIPVITIGLCGGFAVIRDAYWTGKLRIFRSFGSGICQTTLRFLPFTLVFAGGLLGLFYLNNAMAALPSWLVAVIDIVILVVLLLILMIGFVYLGTSTLFRESVGEGLKNALALTFRHIWTNLATFIFMLLPVAVLLFVNVSVIQTMLGVLMVMFGMIYIGIVWMIHMIRVTAPYAAK